MTHFTPTQLNEINRQLANSIFPGSHDRQIVEVDGELQFWIRLTGTADGNLVDSASLSRLGSRITGFTGVEVGTFWIGVTERHMKVWAKLG